MSHPTSGSQLAAIEALAACLRSAHLMPHLAEQIGDAHPYGAHYLSYEVWVTNFGEAVLNPQVFPYSAQNSIVDEVVPENARRVSVDVLVVKHGETWDECFVQIRSGGASQQTWSYRFYRLVPHPQPEAVNWAKATGAAL